MVCLTARRERRQLGTPLSAGSILDFIRAVIGFADSCTNRNISWVSRIWSFTLPCRLPSWTMPWDKQRAQSHIPVSVLFSFSNTGVVFATNSLCCCLTDVHKIGYLSFFPSDLVIFWIGRNLWMPKKAITQKSVTCAAPRNSMEALLKARGDLSKNKSRHKTLENILGIENEREWGWEPAHDSHFRNAKQRRSFQRYIVRFSFDVCLNRNFINCLDVKRIVKFSIVYDIWINDRLRKINIINY